MTDIVQANAGQGERGVGACRDREAAGAAAERGEADGRPTAPDDAWELHVQSRWGGWSAFAMVHTQSSAAAEKAAFEAGWKAADAREAGRAGQSADGIDRLRRSDLDFVRAARSLLAHVNIRDMPEDESRNARGRKPQVAGPCRRLPPVRREAVNAPSPTPPEDDDFLPKGWTRNPDGSVNAPSRTCPRCGVTGVMFICSEKGCPVNGGAFHG